MQFEVAVSVLKLQAGKILMVYRMQRKQLCAKETHDNYNFVADPVSRL